MVGTYFVVQYSVSFLCFLKSHSWMFYFYCLLDSMRLSLFLPAPKGAMGWSAAACACGISLSNSLAFS